MRICLISDAWFPQVNGVVTTWSHVQEQCRAAGHEFEVIHPGLFRTFEAPKYPEIRLAVLPRFKLRRMLGQMAPDAIHIATEGPLGMAGRGWCRARNLPFTTSYHTQFPQYLHAYFGIPTAPTYTFLRWFHGGAQRTLVPSRSIKDELIDRGFDGEKIIVWTRGVRHDTFHPYDQGDPLEGIGRPRFCYVGRVAPEKNIEAFCKFDLPGEKVVIGDGPARAKLEAQYPRVRFLGFHKGEHLARRIAACDVFVFPSLTDTFGVVMIEAMACGLPVAAYPVTGPRDVITDPKAGRLDHDLRAACLKCLELDKADAVAFAQQFTWHRVAQIVLDNLARTSPSPTPARQTQIKT